jgi:hypothetical protein
VNAWRSRSARAVAQPALLERADERVLVQAVADVAVVLEARDVIDDAVLPIFPTSSGRGRALHDERPWYMPWRQSASMP